MFRVHEQEWTTFTVMKIRVMIFIVCKWERTILQYAHFQDLTENDWEVTEMNWKISFMTGNGWYHPFLFAIHERSGMRFSKNNLIPLIAVLLPLCPVSSLSFTLKWQSCSCLLLLLDTPILVLHLCLRVSLKSGVTECYY